MQASKKQGVGSSATGIFDRFCSIVLGSGNGTIETGEQIIGRLLLKYIRITSAMIIILNLTWGYFSFANDKSGSIGNGAFLISMVVQLGLSIFMMILPCFTRDGTTLYVRICFLVYYTAIITNLTFMTTWLPGHTSVSSFPFGSTFLSFFIFIITLLPLPNVFDSLIVLIYMAVSALLPLFIQEVDNQFMVEQLIVRFFLITGYIIIRHMSTNMASNAVRANEMARKFTIASFSDILTDALNRRAMDQYISYIRENAIADYCGVIILDIDDFKKYNDCYSHIKGDEALKNVCHALIGSLSQTGDFLFRYGGEEFVAILPNVDSKKLVLCAKNLNKAVWEACLTRNDGAQYDRITITVGCAIERIGKPGGDLISGADKQLYKGKSLGKNCVFFRGEKQ